MYIKIKTLGNDFIYGNCAVLAISAAFNIPTEAVFLLCRIKNLDPYNGLSFRECDLIIKELNKHYYRAFKYQTNSLINVSFKQLCALSDNSTYIVMFDSHLSLIRNNEIVDSFLRSNLKVAKVYLNYIPTGWWKIQ